MKQAVLIISLALIAAVLGDPVQVPTSTTGPTPPSDAPAVPVESEQDNNSELVNFDNLFGDLRRVVSRLETVQQDVDELFEALETTARNIFGGAPHSIRKRQTTVGGSVDRGPHGSRGNLEINHRRGNTIYNGHLSRGQDGTSYGAGIRHETRRGHIGGSVTRDRWGTLNRVDGSRTWNNGRTSLGGYYQRHSRGGSSGGVRFSHRF